MVKSKRLSRVITILVALSVITLATPTFADTNCQPTPQGSLCISQVNFTRFAQTSYRTQWQSEWCWAACISMIFSYYGHPVRQDRIVATVYGAAYNRPAGAGWVIARELNRDWVDDNGRRFHSRLTGVFDADARVFALNNLGMINALDNNQPLVVASGTHAMVLTAMQYYPGPTVVSVGVFDPWPTSGVARGLSPQEMTPLYNGGLLRFVAAISVTD
jgi:Papain-like cysteine protease AvrRpt2